jgi:hypothetical protein
MPTEVRIQVDVDATGQYGFQVRSDTRQIRTSVNPDLAASFYEDLRLLRWKSAGVHDPGDTLLNHVGERLAALIALPATWEELRLPDEARYVRIQFSQAAHRLMPFPWELLRVNDQFLIGTRGSHLVRGLPATRGRTRKRNPIIDGVHVSLGTDSALRFDEERCTLLDTIPANIPIEFLIDPSAEHLEAVIHGFPQWVTTVQCTYSLKGRARVQVEGHIAPPGGYRCRDVSSGVRTRWRSLADICARPRNLSLALIDQGLVWFT